MNIKSLRAGIKYFTDIGHFIKDAPYDSFTQIEDGKYYGNLHLKTSYGDFTFKDFIIVSEDKIYIRVNCNVNNVSEEVKGLGVSCAYTLPSSYNDLTFFAPSAWYGKGKLFEGKSNKFPMVNNIAAGTIDSMGIPVCGTMDESSSKAWKIEVINASYKASLPKYDASLPFSTSVVIDDDITLSGIGFSRENGCSLIHQFPGTTYNVAGSERSLFYYRKPKANMNLTTEYEISTFTAENYHEFMTKIWRDGYEKYSVINNNVDSELAKRVLIDYVKNSFAVVDGIPQYMTNSDHFTNESGFLFRNADFAYLMLRYGYETNDEKTIENAKLVIDNQVKNKFAGENQVFPFERSRAEGVYAVDNAYNFLKEHGEVHDDWIVFVEKEADRFENTNEYYSIPLLCKMGRLESAKEKGEYIWKFFSEMKFYGGIVDFIGDPVLDRESGLIGLIDFIEIYESTKEEKWLHRASFCGDYLETYQNLRLNDYCCKGTDGNEHYNMASVGNSNLKLNGLSYISANCNGTDVAITLAVSSYYKLFKYLGDKHYYDYACLLQRNSLEYIDLRNKAGALSDVLLGAGMGFMNEYYQLAVANDRVGPLTGTAHDGGIAWVQYALISQLFEIKDLIGKNFIEENKCEEMLQNIADECLFSCNNEKKFNLTNGDFYSVSEFLKGDQLEINLLKSSRNICFAHNKKFANYNYSVEFYKNDELLKIEEINRNSRFVSMDIPEESTKLNIKFLSDVAFNQIQIFAFLKTDNLYTKFLAKNCKYYGDSLEYRSGTDYCPIREKMNNWRYLYKKDGQYFQLKYDNIKNAYNCHEDEFLAVKSGNYIHCGKYVDVSREFTVDKDGAYKITRKISPCPYLVNFGNEIKISVYLNQQLVGEEKYKIIKFSEKEFIYKLNLRKNDRLYFELSSINNNNTDCFVCDDLIIKREN